MSEAQDPKRRKNHMHTLNEWLGQEHRVGFDAGRKEGIEVGLGGKIRQTQKFNLRPIDGKGAPEYCLRIDVVYEYLDDRDEAAGRLKGEEK